MKHYDVNCPVCGHRNLHLFLEETNGWMECERCKSLMQIPAFVKIKKTPEYPREGSGPGLQMIAAAG